MHYEVKESDIFEFARSQNIRVTPNGDEIQFLFCPYCHGGHSRKDRGTFSINRKTGQFKCQRASCGVQGNMITLARDFDFRLTDEFSNFYIKRPSYKSLPQPKEEIIPKPQAVEYLEKRGISAETAKKYEITVRTDNESVLVFPITNENGKLVNIKYRNLNYTPDKQNGIKEWFEQGCMPYLYGVQSWNGKFDRMVLYEGQLDALSGYESGVENSFSVPGGAKGFTWWPPSYEFCSKFNEIIIFGDYENGKITLLDDMKQRYGGTIKHVREEDYKDCKDANEILLKHGKEQVLRCVEHSVLLPIDDVIELADVPDVDVSKIEKLSTGIKQVDRLLYGGLPFGGVTLVAGKPGSGKSTLSSQILVSAISKGYKCFAYSGELPNHMFKSWINYQIAGGKHVFQTGDGIHENYGYGISEANRNIISEWYRGKAYIYDNSSIDSNEHIGLLDAVEKSIKRYGCRVVLIDNLMTALDMDAISGTDKYDKQSHFVKKLTRIALKYDILIILVAHKRKNNFTQDANDEISGSGDIANLGMVTLSYDRNDKSEMPRVIRIAKNRLFGRINIEGYEVDFDERSKRIFGEGDDPDVEYECFDNKTGEFIPVDDDDVVFN